MEAEAARVVQQMQENQLSSRDQELQRVRRQLEEEQRQHGVKEQELRRARQQLAERERQLGAKDEGLQRAQRQLAEEQEQHAGVSSLVCFAFLVAQTMLAASALLIFLSS